MSALLGLNPFKRRGDVVDAGLTHEPVGNGLGVLSLRQGALVGSWRRLHRQSRICKWLAAVLNSPGRRSRAGDCACGVGRPAHPGRLSRVTSPDRELPAAWLFGPSLRAHLVANLGRHVRLPISLDGRRHAAVAVVVVDSDASSEGSDEHPSSQERMGEMPGAADSALTGNAIGTVGGPAVLLTRRATRLRAHTGQWALPGGQVDDGEAPLDAARRELREELDVDLPASALLGVLDDYATRSGYVITPFVLWGGVDPLIHPHPDEVLSVHRVAFQELCRADSPRFVTIPESDRPVVQIPIGDGLIHAPTGAVLLQFRRVAIEGTSERVAGYEQPVFAWR